MKKYYLVILAYLWAILILLTGCSLAAKDNNQMPAEEETPAVNASTYFPLKVGNTWSYLGEGNEYATFTREVLFVTDNLSQIKEDNGGTVTAAVYKSTEQSIIRVFFEGEVYHPENLLNTNLPPNDNTVIINSPIEAGITWSNPDAPRKIIDTDATVETPAGVFEECLHIQVIGTDYTIDEYYKQGIGMVKREYISGDYLVTSRLQDYNLEP